MTLFSFKQSGAIRVRLHESAVLPAAPTITAYSRRSNPAAQTVLMPDRSRRQSSRSNRFSPRALPASRDRRCPTAPLPQNNCASVATRAPARPAAAAVSTTHCRTVSRPTVIRWSSTRYSLTSVARFSEILCVEGSHPPVDDGTVLLGLDPPHQLANPASRFNCLAPSRCVICHRRTSWSTFSTPRSRCLNNKLSSSSGYLPLRQEERDTIAGATSELIQLLCSARDLHLRRQHTRPRLPSAHGNLERARLNTALAFGGHT